MKFSLLFHANHILRGHHRSISDEPHGLPRRSNSVDAIIASTSSANSKLERFPEYIRETMEWILGRSKRKPDGQKDQRLGVSAGAKRPGGSVSQTSLVHVVGKTPSTDFGVCESIDDQMLDKITTLPVEVDSREWLATHTLSLFEHVNAMCGTVSELCTPINCPMMSYPGSPKAQWVDERGKRHPYSAGQYIDCVMSYCEQMSKNEDLFPTKHGCQFSAELTTHCRRVLRLLWHCAGHLFTAHWDALETLQLRSQCGLVLAHLHRLAIAHQLLDSKELAALAHTVQLVRPATNTGSSSSATFFKGRKAACSSTAARLSRVPSSKSGSWGGHPTPSMLDQYKPCAQTC